LSQNQDPLNESHLKSDPQFSFSKRKFLKFLSYFSFLNLSHWIFPLKARAGGFISFAFMKKRGPVVPAAVYVDDLFSTYLYTGNGSTQTITTGLDLFTTGGVLWLKSRSSVQGHILVAKVAGSLTNGFSSNSASQTGWDNNGMGGGNFSTSGFSLGSSAAIYGNGSGFNYAAFSFKKASKFFDVAQVVKSAGSNATVDFSSLGSVGMVFVKRLDATGSWYVWHRSATNGKLLYLEQNVAESAINHVSVSGTTVSLVNAAISDGTYLVMGYAHDVATEGMIQCGSYTGDGLAKKDVTLNFEPQFLMIKRLDSTSEWHLFDTVRGMSNYQSVALFANSTSSESTSAGVTNVEFVPSSTGFSILYQPSGGGLVQLNASGGTYIYMAIRRPNKPITNPTDVLGITSFAGDGNSTKFFSLGMNPDLVISKLITGYNGTSNASCWTDKVRGGLSLALTSAQSDCDSYWSIASWYNFAVMGGYALAGQAYSYSNVASVGYLSYGLRRCPGVLDILAVTTVAGFNYVQHNLGVTPELVIVKNMTTANTINWKVSFLPVSGGGTTFSYSKFLLLNSSSAAAATGEAGSVDYIDSPGRIRLSCGNDFTTRAIVYLFATKAQVSKVGTYTGSGTDVVVPCGFTGSARFVMIKRTDSTSDWYVIDSSRGDTVYFCMNNGNAQSTLTLINFTTGGFTAKASTVANLSGATYLFLAFA
jgi:hypothetical protein